MRLQSKQEQRKDVFADYTITSLHGFAYFILHSPQLINKFKAKLSFADDIEMAAGFAGVRQYVKRLILYV